MAYYTPEEKLLYLIPKLENEHRDFINKFDILYWELLSKELFISNFQKLSKNIILHINNEKQVYDYLKANKSYTEETYLISQQRQQIIELIDLISSSLSINRAELLNELENKLMAHFVKEENNVFRRALEIVYINLK